MLGTCDQDECLGFFLFVCFVCLFLSSILVPSEGPVLVAKPRIPEAFFEGA